MNKLLAIVLSGALTLGMGVGAGVAVDESQPVPDNTKARTAVTEMLAEDIPELDITEVANDVTVEENEIEESSIDILDENEVDDETEVTSDDDDLSVEERIKRNSESDNVWYHIEDWECPGHQWENVYEVDDSTGGVYYSRCCSVCGTVEDLDYCPDDLAWVQDMYKPRVTPPDSSDDVDVTEEEVDEESIDESTVSEEDADVVEE